MAGGHASLGGTPWFWPDQYDPTLQIAGDPALGRGVSGDAAQRADPATRLKTLLGAGAS